MPTHFTARFAAFPSRFHALRLRRIRIQELPCALPKLIDQQHDQHQGHSREYGGPPHAGGKVPHALRQNDPNAEYDDKVDYQTACVLIRRYAIMAGVDTGVDQTQLRQLLRDNPDLNREAAKAMLWCDEKDITTRDSSLDELLSSAGTRISRYQMTSFLFYLCTYELDIGS